MAAFNTATTLAREIRTNTGYARATEEAHTLARQALTGSGDIDTTTPATSSFAWTHSPPHGPPQQSENSASTSPPPKSATQAPGSSCATKSKTAPDPTRNTSPCQEP
ncbi:hypothetical protein AHiyo4_20980 [Arthrobacter sp. Hiyo4]|nr:hypothetical protein AHiyo4_20980 [Arthrobacter sp. Hiyo4]